MVPYNVNISLYSIKVTFSDFKDIAGWGLDSLFMNCLVVDEDVILQNKSRKNRDVSVYIMMSSALRSGRSVFRRHRRC